MDANEAKAFLLTKRANRGKPPKAWTEKKILAEKTLGRSLKDVRGEFDNAQKALLAKTPKVQGPTHTETCPTCGAKSVVADKQPETPSAPLTPSAPTVATVAVEPGITAIVITPPPVAETPAPVASTVPVSEAIAALGDGARW